LSDKLGEALWIYTIDLNPIFVSYRSESEGAVRIKARTQTVSEMGAGSKLN